MRMRSVFFCYHLLILPSLVHGVLQMIYLCSVWGDLWWQKVILRTTNFDSNGSIRIKWEIFWINILSNICCTEIKSIDSYIQNFTLPLKEHCSVSFSFVNFTPWTGREWMFIGQILEAICKLILALWWPGKFWSILDLFKAWNSRTRKIPNSANHSHRNLMRRIATITLPFLNRQEVLLLINDFFSALWTHQ